MYKVIFMMDDKTRPLKQRKPGTAKGKLFIADDFDHPLDDELTDRFYR
jgi:hypothetical protein